jgi:hypothetical protein
MTPEADTSATGALDLDARRQQVRRKELPLKLEEWGPGYQRAAGDGVRYLAEICKATGEEQAWLRGHVTEHGMPEEVARNPEQWYQLRRRQGQQAEAEAKAALEGGDFDTARARLDDMFAHNAITEDEWKRLYEYISRVESERALRE